MKEKMLNAITAPRELESLYQGNPEEFRRVFPDVFHQYSDSIVLQVWNERLFYSATGNKSSKISVWENKSILLIILLSLIAGYLVRLPVVNNEAIDPEWFYSRNLGGILIVSLMIYFYFQQSQAKKAIMAIILFTVGALLFLNFLPYEYNKSSWEFHRMYRSFDDAITVAELHVPLFLWLMLGVVFAGKNWVSSSGRMNFLRYNGEIIVYTTIILIGGMVLTGVTMGLLNLLEESYELTEWYGENIIPFGFAAAPLVASYLIDNVIGRRLNIAPTLAKIFAPLFLITTVSYLVLIAAYGQSPFEDRDNLVAFNILLIVVLGLLIFSIAERDPDASAGLSDYINIGLAATTLVIDLIALWAVLFRMSTDIYGLTPNRTAIIGINLLVFGHLTGILYYYIQFAMKKSSFLVLESWVTKYLPLYAIWSLLISIALPIIYWYQ